MDSNSEDHVGTLIKVNQFAVDNAAALAVNPNIELTRVTLDADTDRIFQNDSTATRPLEGFTQMKNNAANDLANKVLLVRAGCVSYYTANPNPGKKMIVDFPDTKILAARDNDLYMLADQVHDIADPIKAAMVPHSVAAADVDAIPTLADAYRGVLQLPRTEEAISIAAAKERDKYYKKSFEETLPVMDDYMLVFKITNSVLYDKYVVARAIDESGGGSGTEGYNVSNFILAPGASVAFGAGVTDTQEMYFRQIGGTVGVIICTAALNTASCGSGYNLTPGVTLKTNFGTLGLTTNNFIIFTNPGTDTVTVRAGLKI